MLSIIVKNCKTIVLTLALVTGFSITAFSQFRAYKPGTGRAMILDPGGKEFVMRGINLQVGDWDNYNRNILLPFHTWLKARRVNAVRLAWYTGWTNTANDVKLSNPAALGKYIATFAKSKIVSVVTLFGYTGLNTNTLVNSGSISGGPTFKDRPIKSAAIWWGNNRAAIQAAFVKAYGKNIDFEQFAIINIANEVSNSTDTEASWALAYNRKDTYGNGVDYTPISYMRAKGYKGILLIDALNYAQNPNAIYTQGKNIYDPNNNLGFSVHMYDEWGAGNLNKYDPVGHIKGFPNQSRPVIIGEFGESHAQDINEDAIMNTANTSGIGWLAWTLWGEGKYKQLDVFQTNPTAVSKGGGKYEPRPRTPLALTAWGLKLFPASGTNRFIRNYKNPASSVGGTWPLVEEQTPELALNIDATPAPKLEVTVGDLSAKLFPNPTGGAFNLEFNSPEEDNIEVAVYDLKGSRLKQYKQGVVTGENRLELMAPDQPGVYVVQALTDKGKRFASTLVVSE